MYLSQVECFKLMLISALCSNYTFEQSAQNITDFHVLFVVELFFIFVFFVMLHLYFVLLVLESDFVIQILNICYCSSISLPFYHYLLLYLFELFITSYKKSLPSKMNIGLVRESFSLFLTWAFMTNLPNCQCLVGIGLF